MNTRPDFVGVARCADERCRELWAIELEREHEEGDTVSGRCPRGHWSLVHVVVHSRPRAFVLAILDQLRAAARDGAL